MKNKLRYIFSIIIIAGGIIGLFYPTVSNYLNERNNSRIIQSYDATVARLDESQRRQKLEEAENYNQRLLARNGYETPMRDENGNYISGDGYEDMLNMGAGGIMGYLTIPKLSETVPIYHGTSEAVLQSGVGHIENTSLPIGGASTHAALSGHRGLPSKQLFTDLDQLIVGDVFYIKILDETLAYQIDQIITVLPHQMQPLAISEGEDYVTLVTCTPYAVNTHRLLVRGTRISYEEAKEVSESAGTIREPTHTSKELLLAGLVLAAYFIIRFIISLTRKIRKKAKNRI